MFEVDSRKIGVAPERTYRRIALHCMRHPPRGRTSAPKPGLPFSLAFRAEPGREDVVLKIASTYEAASKRRIPPSDFGPL